MYTNYANLYRGYTMKPQELNTTSKNEDPIKKEYSRLYIGICLLLNLILSISIVFVNKLIYTRILFPNMTLTCVHFIFTSFGILICKMLGVFEFKHLPLAKMIPISMTFCGFVVLTNLSLQSNTVGTYQIIKTLTTPGIILIQTFVYHRSFSTRIKLTLIPIIVGVYLNSYFDIRFSPLGIAFALSGVVVTSLYQVWVNEKQNEFHCNSMQLLLYQAPLSGILISLIIPFFEPVISPGGIFGTKWDFVSVLLVVLSGLIAFFLNLSIFWIIGNTSPLTYNMVGHLKFCLTLAGGYLFFNDPLRALQFIGISFTFAGVLFYTHYKLLEQKQEKAAKEKQQQMLTVVIEAEENDAIKASHSSD